MRTIPCGPHHLDVGPGANTCIMGVLNVTPDSFSDGGRFLSAREAVRRAKALVAEGADIVDIGGESTRPFSDAVPAEEEIRRVVPVIEALSGTIDVPISIDTMKAEVAQRAIQAGASIVNDVSALRFDPEMGPLVAAADVPVVLMHMLGSPKTMQVAPRYAEVVSDVYGFLESAIEGAVRQGIDRSRVIVDPGIGFGKNLEHNLRLLAHLDRFASLNAPILVGTSRKKFIRTLLRPEGDGDVPADSPAVVTGTQATVAMAVWKGAHIVRVHDVAAARTTVRIADALRRAMGADGAEG
jgi:dihydropteroate synthase